MRAQSADSFRSLRMVRGAWSADGASDARAMPVDGGGLLDVAAGEGAKMPGTYRFNL